MRKGRLSVYGHASEYRSQWAAITLIASEIGCFAQMISNWIQRWNG